MTSKSAKILYTPFGTVGGIVAGALASKAFDRAWKATRHEGVAPTPRSKDATAGEAILAAVLQGAIFTGTRAAFERLSAVAFQRWAGEWPDDSPTPKASKATPTP